MIYVASSWRNKHYETILDCLDQWALPYFNWRDEHGFHWSEVFGKTSEDHWTEPIPSAAFVAGIGNERAQQGFERDMQHLREADAVILLLPCGKSAHLEAGWAVGAGKPVALYITENLQPELMYGMFDFITSDIDALMRWASATKYLDAHRAKVRSNR